MNNKAHLRPQDFDSNGDIIPMACKEEKGDLISREALKEEMQKADIKANDYETLAKMYENCVDNAPTVAYPFEKFRTMICGTCQAYMRIEPERPKGEWKVYGRQGGIPISDYCTNCKYEMRWYKNKYKFRPNCGASMRKGDAEE